MSLKPLTIIPAGAGSGKTYTIQTRLAEWVTKGEVQPDRIVAVTFTEAAAAELRDRIRAELVNQGRLEDALKLDQAYISTIHGFGLRLLTEFAYDAGLSPAPRLLNEDEESVLIRLALAATDAADEVMGNLTAYGYAYDRNTGKGPEDQFRNAILALIGKLRSIGQLDTNSYAIPHALKKVQALYGPTGTAKHLNSLLQSAVRKLLKKFPNDLSGLFEGNKSAVQALKKDFRALKRAEKSEILEKDWPLWQQLRELRLSKRSSSLPDGYDALAQEVMEAAAALPSHPGPLLDALNHVKALLAAAQDSLNRYAETKREKELVDYADMIALSHGLLKGRRDILAEFRSRVDCLVIDEFQDTNPLQFALLWALSRAGVPTLIVGDLKQAIMGFQNADSRLLEQLQADHPTALSPLTANWRSSKPLMDWINQVGKGLFGKGYTSLTPKANFESKLSPLEVIEFPEQPKHRSTIIPAQHTALRIKALLEDRTQRVYDKELDTHRRLRAGDIAVICPTNSRLEKYAEALRSVGIRTQMEQDGWLSSRIIQIAYHALSYVADPADRHAALYLIVTELGALDLETAIARHLRNDSFDDPILTTLDGVADAISTLTVDAVVDRVVEALDLHGRIALWPDTPQARVNLLRLQGEAREFMGSNREALASGGYYGMGLKTFLAWLQGKAERDDRQPEPSVISEDAVQLLTWHRAKGKEWPVVAICATDSDVSVRLPSTDVVYKDFTDLSKVLERARLEISPSFAAPETSDKFREPLQEIRQQEARRLLYVALTRAREKTILEAPVYQEGKDTVSYWTLLKEAAGIEISGNTMKVGTKIFDCRVVQAGKEAPEFEVTAAAETLPVIGRRAIEANTVTISLTPEAVTPSSLHGAPVGNEPKTSFIQYGEPLNIGLDLSATDRGTFLHRCFEVAGCGPERLDHLFGIEGIELDAGQHAAITDAAKAFQSWCVKELAPVRIDHEVPILVLDAQESVVSGSIDLLVETKEGFWIIDHKSDVTEDIEGRFLHYLPQLRCYAHAVGKARTDKPVLGVGVNWISRGGVILFMHG